jgi:hypothetical protein
LVKSIRSAVKRVNSVFYKLEKLIIKYLSNRLAKALKYIKAEFLNIGYIIAGLKSGIKWLAVT